MHLVHSVPVTRRAVPCETTTARPGAALRPYVLGYATFASGDGRPVRHRVFPLTTVTLIIDLAGYDRVVTGPHDAPVVHTGTAWASGVTVGLTPAGARALLGVPMAELAGATVPLHAVLGGADAEIAERLHGAPTPIAALDDVLRPLLTRGPEPDPVLTRAWARMHAPGQRVGAVAAAYGVSRRYLETGFRRRFGQSPGRVGRIARFQRAVALLAGGAGLPDAAAASGYADQPHFTRDVRRMSGVTPTELCALLQDAEPV